MQTERSICRHATTLCFHRQEKQVILMSVPWFSNDFYLGDNILLTPRRKNVESCKAKEAEDNTA